MDEYIKRDAALNIVKGNWLFLTSADDAIQTSIEMIRRLPAVDVRPVVLCKNCKHRPAKEDGRIKAPEDADGYTDYNCPFVCDDSWYNRMPADDDYCSLGEKREESK